MYGCRKADTGKMYAMKVLNIRMLGVLLYGAVEPELILLPQCLDKKRIKMKQGETLALNERIMLSLVSTGHGRTPLIITSGQDIRTS